MANQEHLDRLKEGVDAWNARRQQFPDLQPDLREANLREANLNGADLNGADLNGATLSGANLSNAYLSNAYLSNAFLRGATLSGATLSGAVLNRAYLYRANLSNAFLMGADLNGADLSNADLSGAVLNGADLSEAHLSNANLRGADLSEAHLYRADLSGADLSGADLNGANLSGANFRGADLSGADLNGADLSGATLIETNFTDAILNSCHVYGISVWDITLQGCKQLNLIITRSDQAIITVDTLEVAQFIYLLVNNPSIRQVIDTIARKAVLILGRFTPERKAILELLRDELRSRGYVPILFDFQKPDYKDVTETVTILAHLSRFVLVDLTDPNSAPYEVATIASTCICPLQPLLLKTGQEFPLFTDLRRRYHWILPIYRYQDAQDLRASLDEKIILVAEQKAQKLMQSHPIEEST